MPHINKRTVFSIPDYSPSTTPIDAIILFDDLSAHLAFVQKNKVMCIQIYEHKDLNIHNFSENDLNAFALDFQNFSSLTLLYNSPKDTLIPSQSFDKSLAEKYITFIYQSIENEVLAFDDIKNLDITHVYTIKKPFFNYFKTQFPQVVFKNKKSSLIEHFSQHNEQNDNVYVNTNSNSFDCVVFKKNNLFLANTFTYNSAQNYIFYLMHVLISLNLNTETIHLYLSGSIEEKSAIYDYIYKYIRHIHFIQKPKHIEYVSEDMPFHYFFNLLNV